MTRLTRRLDLSRGAKGVFLAMILVVMTGCDYCDKGDTSTSGDSGGKEHQLYVKASGGYCTVTDADGNVDLNVERGDWITWNNSFGSDIQLNFSELQRLLGVYKAAVYTSGEGLRLRVRMDADYGDHPYVPSCGTTQPGPKIIVNPPGGNG
jgi:hypothetical protein